MWPERAHAALLRDLKVVRRQQAIQGNSMATLQAYRKTRPHLTGVSAPTLHDIGQLEYPGHFLGPGIALSAVR